MQTAITTRTYAVIPAHFEIFFTFCQLTIAKVRRHFTGLHGSFTLGAGDVPMAVEAAIDATSI